MKDYRGVKWIEKHQKWQSSVRHEGVHYPCGMYTDQMAAVKARDTMIIQKGLKVKLQVFTPVEKKKKP